MVKIAKETVDQVEEITFYLTFDGRMIFPWWNPLAQEIIDAVDGVEVENSGSKFCG